MAPNEMTVQLFGRILSVGEGTIVLDVSPPSGASRQVAIPAQRGQEEWAGARIYKQVTVSIVVKADT